MNLADIPTKFPIVWGESAGGAYINAIPTASQIGPNPGYASLTDGFVPLNAQPVGAGGIPPRIQDMNGILNEVTAWNQWQQAGGPITYDATFQTAIGGYPNNAVVRSATTAGRWWRSTVDANVTNPDAAGAGWVDFFAPVYASPTFTGTVTTANLTVGGAAVFNSTLTANATVNVNATAVFTGPTTLIGQTNFPNSTYMDNIGTLNIPTGQLRMGSLGGGLNPANAMLTVVNPSGTAAQFQNILNVAQAPAAFVRSDRTDGYLFQFLFGNTLVGWITTNGSVTTYNSASDYRVKDNIEPMDGAAARLMRLKPVRFNWTHAMDAPKVDGFLAHEVADVVQEAVTGGKDAVANYGELVMPAGSVLATEVPRPSELAEDSEWVETGEIEGPVVTVEIDGEPVEGPSRIPVGTVQLTTDRVINSDTQEPDDLPPGMVWRFRESKPILQGLDQAKLVPLLVAALQEALGRIEALEGKTP